MAGDGAAGERRRARVAPRVSRRPDLLAAGAVALLAALLYGGTLTHYFAADDFIFLHQLHFQQPALPDSLVYFTRDWGLGASFYRPLTRLAWAAEFSLFGLNAWGWHLASVLLYASNTALLYLLCRALTARPLAGLVAALLFAVHPSHAETVSWVANQSDLLAAAFVFLCLLLYIGARRAASLPLAGGLYAISLACMGAALLCKESAAGALGLPPAYEVVSLAFSRGATWRRWLLAVAWQLPLLGVLALYGALRLAALGGVGGYGGTVDASVFVEAYARWLLMPFGDAWPGLALALLVIALLAIWALTPAVAERVAPLTLAEKEYAALPPPVAPRAAIFGLCWLGLFLAPLASTAPSVRFVYLPSAGLAIFVAAIVQPLLRAAFRRQLEPRATSRFGIRVDLLLGLALVAALSAHRALNTQEAWSRGSASAQSVLREMRAMRPELDDYSYVYAVGVPEANEEALIFRTGFAHAVQLAYDNLTVEVVGASRFRLTETRLNRAFFVQYVDGRMVDRDDIVQALLRRNELVKADEAQVAVEWDFQAGGGGRFASPPLEVQARDLHSLQVTARRPGGASGKAEGEVEMLVRWLAGPEGGVSERGTTRVAVPADGLPHLLSIRPADFSIFFYDDVLRQVVLEVPPGAGTFEIGRAKLRVLSGLEQVR